MSTILDRILDISWFLCVNGLPPREFLGVFNDSIDGMGDELCALYVLLFFYILNLLLQSSDYCMRFR